MTDEVKNEIRQLSRIQRRVIGVLMEKAFTTPEQYPLTLKATTTGCNQKNNRDPVSDYSEDQVADTLEQLRELGLIAEVYTDGGRAARYRHYMRQKFDFNETQFAIVAELLLRGRQQLGELRTRASRMVKIESQEQLKNDLISLQQKGFIQANGALERRGIEVDHTFYAPKEGNTLQPAADEPGPAGSSTFSEQAPRTATVTAHAASATSSTSFMGTRSSGAFQTATTDNAALTAMSRQIGELNDLITSLQTTVESLEERLHRIERDLGI